jgi:hypothetical protein
MVGRGGDQQARQDMFPTQVAEWRTQERIGSPPIGTGSSFDVTGNPIQVRLRGLSRLRDDFPGLSRGASVVRYAQARILVVSRIDHTSREEYVTAFNAGTAPAHVRVLTSTPRTLFRTILGSVPDTGSLADGSLQLDLPALSSVVLHAVGTPAVKPPVPTLRVGADNLSNMWRVTAGVRGRANVTVVFAVKRGRAAWRRLVADDSPPYRAFLDPLKFRRNERVQLAAVARGLDGSTSISKTVTFRIRRR